MSKYKREPEACLLLFVVLVFCCAVTVTYTHMDDNEIIDHEVISQNIDKFIDGLGALDGNVYNISNSSIVIYQPIFDPNTTFSKTTRALESSIDGTLVLTL